MIWYFVISWNPAMPPSSIEITGFYCSFKFWLFLWLTAYILHLEHFAAEPYNANTECHKNSATHKNSHAITKSTLEFRERERERYINYSFHATLYGWYHTASEYDPHRYEIAATINGSAKQNTSRMWRNLTNFDVILRTLYSVSLYSWEADDHIPSTNKKTV